MSYKIEDLLNKYVVVGTPESFVYLDACKKLGVKAGRFGTESPIEFAKDKEAVSVLYIPCLNEYTLTQWLLSYLKSINSEPFKLKDVARDVDESVSLHEKLEASTAERDQLSAQVEILKQFISQQAIPNLLVLSDDYPQCLGINSAITDANELVKVTPVKCLADIRAKAIRKFVSDTNETGQLSFSDCQWLEDWRDEWLEEAAKGGE